MTYVICIVVAFLACVIGKNCGMGGGVIIKPVLDALGIAAETGNFLSGCTAIGMSCWSVGKSIVKKDSQVDWKISTYLAVGAAAGGIAGKSLYKQVAAVFADPNTAGLVQASVLTAALIATLIYTLQKQRVRSMQVKNPAVCILIGLVLGMMGAFLGLGGGPFNMAVLFLFFSMPTRVAAQNSIYIILISQGTAVLKTVLYDGAPQVTLWLLLAMVAAGILGSEIGGRLNKKLSEQQVNVLFNFSVVLVILISLYNIAKFIF